MKTPNSTNQIRAEHQNTEFNQSGFSRNTEHRIDQSKSATSSKNNKIIKFEIKI